MSEIFIGIDVHQKQSFYCALNLQGQCLGHAPIPTDRESLEKLVKQYGEGCKVNVALETGGSTWWVAVVLKASGAFVYPVNARELKLIAHSKRKTDKYDSKVLADLLRCGGLPRIVHLPSESTLKLRSHLRLRKWLVRHRAQTIVRAKALMRQVGVSATGRAFYTARSWERYLGQHQNWAGVLQPMYDVWTMLTDQIKQVENGFEGMLPENDERMLLLNSIPGIGPVTARTFVSAVEDVGRFSNANQIVSYAGFAPAENSSGERHRMGAITKRGRTELRDTYVEAAWTVLRSSRPETAGLKRFFYRIMRKRCSQVAIVALAKKLLVISYYVLKQRTPFDVDRYVAKAA